MDGRIVEISKGNPSSVTSHLKVESMNLGRCGFVIDGDSCLETAWHVGDSAYISSLHRFNFSFESCYVSSL